MPIIKLLESGQMIYNVDIYLINASLLYYNELIITIHYTIMKFVFIIYIY